jgi:hypothetical protein
MQNIRSLFDKSEDHSSEEDEETDAFTGGHRSGLAVRYPGEKSKKSVLIYSFSNGFIIGDGQFRPLSIPENAVVIESLRNGSVPEELRSLADPASGELNVELKQYESEYDPANPPAGLSRKGPAVAAQRQSGPQPFSGTSRTLAGARVTTTSVAAGGENFPVPSMPPGSLPASIQIRLPTGARLSRSFDSSMSGSALLTYISQGLTVDPATVCLSAGFPPKPLTNDQLQKSTLAELGLSGASVQVTLVNPRS